jgi:hypothetical protein
VKRTPHHHVVATVSPELAARMRRLAAERGESRNSWLTRAIETEAARCERVAVQAAAPRIAVELGQLAKEMK